MSSHHEGLSSPAVSRTLRLVVLGFLLLAIDQRISSRSFADRMLRGANGDCPEMSLSV